MVARITAFIAALALSFAACGQDAETAAPDDEAAVAAEEADEPKWSVVDPPLPTTDVTIDVDEGTWMSLDVSPDGRTIAFDLLGDIYTLPIAGGEATAIASGFPWEMQPRFSPDGARIAFISDREGGDNIWIMNADGSDLRQVTKESFRLLNNPTWSPDGAYIAGRKHFTTSRSLGTGEIWLYHLGGGSGVQLVERPSEAYQKELGEPMFSPDGRFVYYTQSSTPGNSFQYADDSNGQLFVIKRYELETGDIDVAVSGTGGAVRPTPSPDGASIAFVRRERADSKLYLKDLTSGEVRMLHDLVDQDLQEVWGVQGLYPNMDWTPDSRALVFWDGGRIKKLTLATGAVEVIPFHVADTRAVIAPPRPQVEVAPDTFETRMPRFATVSPDGGRVVFESLGKLYVQNAAGGDASRLTRDESGRRELFPSWSRDGSRIVFVTWDDDALGSVRTVNANGRGERAVTNEPGHYRRPVFSPDGGTVVFEKGSGGFLTAPEWSESTGVFRAPSGGGDMTKITGDGGAPQFAAAGDRLFLTVSGDDQQKLISVDLNGQDRRDHASGGMVQGYAVSPTGDHLAFLENYDAYVMPMTPGPQNLDAAKGGGGVPIVEVSADGATWPHWTHGGAQINWTLGPTLYSARVADALPDLPEPPKSDDDDDDDADGDAADADDEAADDGFAPPTDGVSLAMTVTAAKPDGLVALVGAKVVTMTGDDGGVIDDGVVLIDANRIVAVGARADIDVPATAHVIDVAGKVITPGFIDAHSHGSEAVDDIIPEQNWSAQAHLAFGVTTIFNPSSSASAIFAASEYQRAGALLGPRAFSTGEVVYGAKAPGFFADIQDLDDAREHVRRLKFQGAHAIKNYNQPQRLQRLWVVAAAKEEDLAVVAEGGSLFHMDLAMVADGNTSIEHNLPQSTLYEDVLSFYSQTEVGYTPTLGVTYGGMGSDPYWRMVDDVWLHPILSRHVPPAILIPRNVRRTKAPDTDFHEAVSAKTAKALAERGVPVSIGAHGQEWGMAAHWEMWSFARGGMSPIEILKRATVDPARHLGFDRDLGSLEAGKLADLVVMNADPLQDIRNSDDIAFVMLNGRLYDALTLNEVETGDARRPAYYWE